MPSLKRQRLDLWEGCFLGGESVAPAILHEIPKVASPRSRGVHDMRRPIDVVSPAWLWELRNIGAANGGRAEARNCGRTMDIGQLLRRCPTSCAVAPPSFLPLSVHRLSTSRSSIFLELTTTEASGRLTVFVRSPGIAETDDQASPEVREGVSYIDDPRRSEEFQIIQHKFPPKRCLIKMRDESRTWRRR